MKCKTKTCTKFNPITFEITAETEEELNDLWVILNVSTNEVIRNNNDKALRVSPNLSNNIQRLWTMVNNKLQENK